MPPDTSNAALAQRYDTIAYAAQPHPLTQPDRLASVATFLGMQPAAPATCRVLEVGCNDGTNLIPMAVGLPGASFVGCDLSGRAIAAGRAIIDELQLRNIALVEEDLAQLDPAHGQFDYIIAHGVYSWVPAPVRDALFALAATRLTTHGVLFVSFNALPGSHVRQAAWEVLHHHVDGIAEPHARLVAARRIAGVIAEAGAVQHAADEALRAEFRAIAERPDSALFHDDLALPNDPFYFRDVVAHAGRHDLAYLAEAELHSMSGAGLSPDARTFLSTMPALQREQYLDFVRLRRFRQSLWRHRAAPVATALEPERIESMHVSADPSLLRAASAGKLDEFVRGLDPVHGERGPVRPLLDRVLQVSPASIAFEQLRAPVAAQLPPSALASVLSNAFVANLVQLHVHPAAMALTPGDRPMASSLARLQARSQFDVVNLLHTRVQLADPNARRLLGLLDGTQNRSNLTAAMSGSAGLPDRATASAFVEHALPQFARLALLLR